MSMAIFTTGQPLPCAGADKERRIAELIRTLREAERELHELTDGQVDAVAGNTGEPILLREAQEQLRQSENAQRQLAATQQAILNALPVHIALLDENGVILAVNEAWRRFGEENVFDHPQSGVGLNYLDICSRAAADGVGEATRTREGILQVLRGEIDQFEEEYFCEGPEGTYWFRLIVTPTIALGTGSGPATSAVISHHNITARKKAELERQKLVHDLGERVKELNTLYEITRLFSAGPASPQELLQSVAAALCTAMRHPELAAARVCHGSVAGATPGFQETPWCLRQTSLHGEGITDCVEIFYLARPPRPEPAGAAQPADADIFTYEEECLVKTVIGQLRSYFQRQRAADALRLSEASMAAAQRVGHFGSWELVLDPAIPPTERPLTWSDEMYRIAGFEPGTVTVTNALFFSLVPLEEHSMIRQAVAATIASGGIYQLVHRLIRADGEVRLIQETAKLFSDESTGMPLKMIGTAHDITEQRRAEEALQQSEREQRDLVRQLEAEHRRLVAAQRVGKVGTWEVDFATLAVDWSDEMHHIFETDPETFQPTFAALLDFLHPADRDAANQAYMESLAHPGSSAQEQRLLLPDGRIKHAEQRWQTFFDAAGTPLRVIGTCQDITERRQATEEIEQTSALLRAVADGTTDAIYVKDLQGRYQFFNEGASRTVGRPVQEVLGLDDTFLHPAEDARVLKENDRLAITSGKPVTLEEEITSPTAGRRTFHATKAPYLDSAGNVIGVIGISRDITARKQQERRLGVLSSLGRHLSTATTARDAAEIITAAADDLFGWDAAILDLYSTADDIITSVLSKDLIDGERRECTPAHDNEPPSILSREIIEHGPRLILRAEPARNDGTLLMFGDTARPSASLMFVPIRDSEQTFGVLSIQSYQHHAYTAEDLKLLELLADYCNGALNRIQTETLRRVSEERFREMAENIGDIFYSYDPGTNRLLYANSAFERLWGRPLETMYDNPLVYLQDVHPEDREAVEAALHSQLDGVRTEQEFRILRQDGGLCWVREVAVPILDADNKVERIVGTQRDITDRRLIDDQLEEQAALLDKAQDAILVRDLDDRVLFWNKSAERLFGWTAQEALGRPIGELIYKDSHALDAATNATLTQGEWTGEMVKNDKTGRPLIIECHWSLVRDEKGAPKSILMIDTDVTERKSIEQQYLRAQRMESIGTLAGGIAHDLNNVLAPILMSIELLRLQEKNPLRLNVLTTIEQSATRGADMVRQVLSFARGVEGRQLEVDVARLVKEIEKITNETFLKNIRVSTELPDGLWRVQGDPTQLHQVLLNLCVNARDAMPDGGALALAARNVMLDDHYVGMNIEARPGPHVRIRVEDTGEGMSPEVIDRIFEPFFTTKELGKGTGLGLSTTLAIVKSHGGFVRVYSEPGKGTRFHVYFPAHAETSAGTLPPPVSDLPRGNGELVLVIDDEEAVRHITSHTLEAFGYEVVVASDGADAIALYAARQEEIALVLTDMMMPIMDGPATIQVLMRMNPDVRIIAASGLNANGMVARATSAGVKHFIPKPYTAETLLTTVQSVLQA